MNIRQDLVSKDKYPLKCPYALTPKYIVIHNTLNYGSAQAEITYMKNNKDSASFHYAVDDAEAVQGIPENRNAFHAGDGINGKGNRQGIAIEICYSYYKKQVNGKWIADEGKWQREYKSKFLAAEDNAAKLTVLLLKKYGLGISAVKKHQDFSGKYCPHRTLDMGWDRFIRKVEFYMAAFKDTQGHWAEKHIEKLKTAGIVNGHADGTFRPDEQITRAEAAVMMANVLTYLGK